LRIEIFGVRVKEVGYGMGWAVYGMVRYGLGLRWCDGCGLQEADDRCDMEGAVIEDRYGSLLHGG
jgi:hypothetical protein